MAVVDSMGRCNIFWLEAKSGDDDNGAEGSSGALLFTEERSLAAMEEWTVAE
jgi:hypothetical protein